MKIISLKLLCIFCRNVLKNREPVYQAIWADSTDFDEVLISPVMLQDHMPDKILAALKKVIGEFDDERGSSVHSYSTASWSEPVNGVELNGMNERYWNPHPPPSSSSSSLS